MWRWGKAQFSFFVLGLEVIPSFFNTLRNWTSVTTYQKLLDPGANSASLNYSQSQRQDTNIFSHEQNDNFPTSLFLQSFSMINCSKALHLVPLVLLAGCLGLRLGTLQCWLSGFPFFFPDKSLFPCSLGEPDYFSGVR